jgi:hypothetical protein
MSTLEADVKLPHPDRQVDNLLHLERIAKAMGDPREFEYTGEVRDLGAMKGNCACGHAIRYEFPVRHKTTGREVIIGSVCIDSSVPWLIANGAEHLAESLRRALEANEEAKKEAMRRLRDAKNSEEVQVLEAYWVGLKEWHSRTRQEKKEAHVRWMPDYLHRGLPKISAQSTPGRTAASIRMKIVTLMFQAIEDGTQFPRLPDDAKLKEKVVKKFEEEIKRVQDNIERYKKYDFYKDLLPKEKEKLAHLHQQKRSYR